MSTDSRLLKARLVSTGPLRLIAVSYLSAAPAGVREVLRVLSHPAARSGVWRDRQRLLHRAWRSPELSGWQLHARDRSACGPRRRARTAVSLMAVSATCGWKRCRRFRGCPSRPHSSTTRRSGKRPWPLTSSSPPGGLGRSCVCRKGLSRRHRFRLPLLGRPTCMALPAAMAHGSVISSGCIGNRVYTGLGDDELYLMIPGPRLGGCRRSARR